MESMLPWVIVGAVVSIVNLFFSMVSFLVSKHSNGNDEW